MAQRRGLYRVAALLPAAILGLGGCASGSGRVGSPEDTMTVDATPGPIAFECGQAFTPPGSNLILTAQFPAAAAAGDEFVVGLVEVTSPVAVAVVTGPQADVFLVRDGLVATVPLAQDSVGERWDLAPGEPRSLPGSAALLACGPVGGRVTPGSYQLYARVVLTPDQGPAMEAFGGPWPLTVA